MKTVLALLLLAACAIAQQPVTLRNHLIVGGTASPTFVIGSGTGAAVLTGTGGTLYVGGVALGTGGGAGTPGGSSGQLQYNNAGSFDGVDSSGTGSVLRVSGGTANNLRLANGTAAFTVPSANGTSGQVLTFNGTLGTSWTTVSGGSGGSTALASITGVGAGGTAALAIAANGTGGGFLRAEAGTAASLRLTGNTVNAGTISGGTSSNFTATSGALFLGPITTRGTGAIPGGISIFNTGNTASGFLTTETLGADYDWYLPNAPTRLPISAEYLTFIGPTAARTITLPNSDFAAARTDAAQTFNGTQTFNGAIASGTAGLTLASGTAAFTVPSETGTNGQVLTFNGSGGTSWTTVSGGTGGLTIGGSSGQVQYNNSGALAGASNLTVTGGTLGAITITNPTISTPGISGGTINGTTLSGTMPNLGIISAGTISAATITGGTATGLTLAGTLVTGTPGLLATGTNMMLSATGTGGIVSTGTNGIFVKDADPSGSAAAQGWSIGRSAVAPNSSAQAGVMVGPSWIYLGAAMNRGWLVYGSGAAETGPIIYTYGGVTTFSGYLVNTAGFKASENGTTPSAGFLTAGSATGASGNGGLLSISGGAATGTGAGGSVIGKTTAATGTAGSSTAQSYMTRFFHSAKPVVVSTGTAATTFATLGVGTGKYAGGVIGATVLSFGTGGSLQSQSSHIYFDAINATGTASASISQVDNTAAVSSGTLTVAYSTVVTGTSIALQVLPTTSLGTSARIKWSVLSLQSDQAETSAIAGSIITPQ